ncbi:hypothetical protein L1I30_10085 [Gillisia sp. M10.2A]|uniref:Anti-sigma factor n=1 Tax=Gillisia lutea TaxID=2909668 RepID=A0ABS9EKN5_9FLAO|nr:hypothetical protein [Gillisia lutea]MCF4102016.1 hypothetical protein [Gillisia lutea]
MESNKFENAVKQQLQDRELTPSANSWNKLQGMLETEEKKKQPKQRIWWLGIAATILAGIVVFSFFFNKVEPTPQVVETPVETVPETPVKKVSANTLLVSKEEIAVVEEAKVSKANSIKKKNEAKTPITEREPLLALVESGTHLKEAKPYHQNTDSILQNSLEKADHGLTENVIETNNTGDISDEELDMLLAQATSKIKQEQNFKHLLSKVNANSLLENAEMEMDDSFRAKVFEVLKEQYLAAKTAVTTRNY